MRDQYRYQSPHLKQHLPNRWDVLALLFVLSGFALLAFAAQNMVRPYELGEQLPISLHIGMLPGYAALTTVRMAIALCCSLLFSFIFGTLSAKSKKAEAVIIPLVDILQSVPILGFLSITIVGFIQLFPGSLLGPECAAIFAIFTSQAWNMIISFYQSLKMVPQDLREVAKMVHLSSWQTFWRIEVPFAIPSLLWNTMISLSGGWFFVVACEAISVANQHIYLPGMGSYIALAIQKADMTAVCYAIVTMLLLILLYDQCLFRPLIVWSEKFLARDPDEVSQNTSWVLTMFRQTHWWRLLGNRLRILSDLFVNRLFQQKKAYRPRPVLKVIDNESNITKALLVLCCIALLFLMRITLFSTIAYQEVLHVAILGIYTAIRVLLLTFFCALIWVPIGVWVGLRPRVAQWVQPIAQFLAAFPANLVYPVAVVMIVRYQLSVDIWTAPLMILGTQWYLLFNVIAGTRAIPRDIILAARNFQVRGWLWWKSILLPAIFPYLITGALAAAGGAWNASIVAEVINWGDATLVASGLGAYITQTTTTGDFPRIVLGISVMCLYVFILNRCVWQKLYNLAEKRFSVS